MLTAIRALPSSTIIATDDPSYVYAGTGRDLLTLPTNTVLVTGRPNRRLSQHLAEMASILCRHDSVVAVGTPAFYMTSFSAGELAPYARLTLVGAYPDGTLYRVERC